MTYTLIQGARLVDGTGRAPLTDGAVLAEGEGGGVEAGGKERSL